MSPDLARLVSPHNVTVPRAPSRFWANSDKSTVILVPRKDKRPPDDLTIDSRGVAFGVQMTVTIARENVLTLIGTGGHAVHWVIVYSRVDSPIEVIDGDKWHAENPASTDPNHASRDVFLSKLWNDEQRAFVRAFLFAE